MRGGNFEAAYENGPTLRRRVDDFLVHLDQVSDKADKRTLKSEAVEMVGSGSTLRSMIGRGRHVPSRILIERLKAVDPQQNPRAQALIRSLEPWEGRRELKASIIDLLDRSSIVFGDRRPRRIRVSHASTKSLRSILFGDSARLGAGCND